MVFHNGSNYDYHFIITELAKEFKGEFNCLGENTKKFETFSVPITEKGKRIDERVEIKPNIRSHKLQFIDSPKSIAGLLLSLDNNLAEGIDKINL